MGAEQSSSRGGSAQDRTAAKTCYYEVLGVDRKATDDEIKKAYRKKALELHPDRNYSDVENATIKFAEVSSAYEVLSDPQERAWYDSHRDSILRGDNGGSSEEDHFERNVRLTSARDIVLLISKFNPRIPFTDDPNGFYGILRSTFENLAGEEDSACSWDGVEPILYPRFGSSKDSYEDVVKPFYRTWINFSTKKTFSWKDQYRSSDAPDRATRRLIEKENKRFRDEGIREFNDAVRALVSFVRKRDPRFLPNFQTEADRQKILRDAAAAQAARSRAANQIKLDQHILPDWAKINPPEQEPTFPDSSDSEIEHIECVVCGKTFKSENQYQAHEKSKKHIKAVQQVQREMRKENQRLKLNELPETGPGHQTKENISGREKIPDSPDELSFPVQDLKINEDEVEEKGFSQSGLEEELSYSEVSEEVESDSSEVEDEYAPRQDVENRLGSLSDSKAASEEGLDSATTATTVTNDNANKSLPKLGKAKAKRAKKAARHETEAAGGTPVFKCVACKSTFPSKTKLFNHIKKQKHAQSIPVPVSVPKG